VLLNCARLISANSSGLSPAIRCRSTISSVAVIAKPASAIPPTS
jgi:hypothetical protein